MKKLISLLLTLALLCCCLSPALAETATAPTITVGEFKPAMEALAKRYVNWDLEWTDMDGLTSGNMITNPILILNAEGYVTMSMVGLTITADDDLETMTDLFLVLCNLTAAVPLVCQGQSVEEASEATWPQMQALFAQLGTSSMGFATINGCTTMVMLTDQPDGSVDLTLTIVYNDPTLR